MRWRQQLKPKRANAERWATLLPGIAFAGDVLAIVLGLVTGYLIRFQTGLFEWIPGYIESSPPIRAYIGLLLVGTGFLVAALAQQRVYERENLIRTRRLSKLIVTAVGQWLLVYLAFSLVVKLTPPISRIYACLSAIACGAMVLAWRYILVSVIRRRALGEALVRRVLIVGWNERAAELYAAIRSDPGHFYRVTACCPAPSTPDTPYRPGADVPCLRSYTELNGVLTTRSIDVVVLADLDVPTHQIVTLANECEKNFVEFKVVPGYFQILVSGLHLEQISGVPILSVSRLPLDSVLNRALKRALDIVGAVVGLVLSAPIIAVCAWRIRCESPGPWLFRQERVGRYGRKFELLKLRSMKLGAEQSDHLNQSTLRNDSRLLRFGEFMRRRNLDELPQFWNVLMGDMSLVGPRPERTFHSDKLGAEIPHYNARYTIRPGITGWAQISGLRGNTDITERIRHDLYYLENWSILLDLQILCMTLSAWKNAY